jgi:hypothetical protein
LQIIFGDYQMRFVYMAFKMHLRLLCAVILVASYQLILNDFAVAQNKDTSCNNDGNTSSRGRLRTAADPGFLIVREDVNAIFYPKQTYRKPIDRKFSPYYSRTLDLIVDEYPAQESVGFGGRYYSQAVIKVFSYTFVARVTTNVYGGSPCLPKPSPGNAGNGTPGSGTCGAPAVAAKSANSVTSASPTAASGCGPGGGGTPGGGGDVCVPTYQNNYCAGVVSLVAPRSVVAQGLTGFSPEFVSYQAEDLKTPEIQLGQWAGQSWREEG